LSIVLLKKNKNTMKKIIITYGLIGGVIVSVIMLATHPLVEDGSIGFDNGMLVGYASMVIALSMIFFGVKTYRDQHLKGAISFWQAVKIGVLITLVASVMYALTWEVYYNTSATDFMSKYTQYYLDKMAQEGASTAEIDQVRTEMENFSELYKNPLIRFGATLTEILPVGVVITLLCAALLRKREILPA
jgi:hypothetical protein